jgi:hypothetical protein
MAPLSPGVKRIGSTPCIVGLHSQWITFSEGRAHLVVRSLLEYLRITLDSQDPEYVKVCQNPGCRHKRYFIGRKKTDKYCSPDCRSWADRRDKREWWAANRGKGNKTTKH